MFILTLEWFGLPDERKRHGIQLEYGFKGKTNDELRQAWMAAVVPFMEEVGHRRARPLGRGGASAGSSTARSRRAFDAEASAWLLDEGAIALGRGDGALEGPRADERATTSARLQKGYRAMAARR